MKRFISLLITAILLIAPLNTYCFGTSTEDSIKIINVVADDPSEFGYVRYNFVNQDGEVETLDDNVTIVDRPTCSASATAASLPSSYDSRTNNCITAPKDQGVTSNCWAFSAISVLETASLLQGFSSEDLDDIDYSEAHMAWFATKPSTEDPSDLTYGDGNNSMSPYETGGNASIATAALTRWSGVAQESDFPFYPYEPASMGNYGESRRYDTGSGVVIKSSESLESSYDVKQWIINYGSVTAPFYFTQDYYNANTGAYNNCGYTYINHEIVIIGWDDNYAVNNFNSSVRPEAPGAWLCKGTWGEDWANDGYFWISYETYFQYFNGYTTQPADKYSKNYTYNGDGWNCFSEIANSASIANVFKCATEETLAAISTYTVVPNCTLNIKIYTNLAASYTNPTNGELASSWTTKIERAGYHTIELPEEIPLTDNSYFSIVIEFVSSGSKVYIPSEAASQDGYFVYSSREGESFVIFNNAIGWQDPTAYGLNNVCIQAFTKCEAHECDHQFETTDFVASTCIENGHEKITCLLCGAQETYVLPLSTHSFGEWSDFVETEDPEIYERSRTCSVCDYTETEETYIPQEDPPADDDEDSFFVRLLKFFIELIRAIFS